MHTKPRASSSRGLDAIESASRDELSALQLERLQWSVDHAYRNVPHYRLIFDRAGVYPNDLRELSDLVEFPFLAKSDLREQYPFGLFAVPRDQIARIHASSGTTGKPTVVGYTKQDIDTWAQLVARSIYAAGVRPGQMVHIAYGYGLFTGGLGAHYGAERLGCSVVPMSGGQTEKQVQLIEDFEPDAIAGGHGEPSNCRATFGRAMARRVLGSKIVARLRFTPLRSVATVRFQVSRTLEQDSH